ncbi:MAG: TrkH family potassium uptake protein [Flavobacteriaceae bacterium]
MFYKLNYKVILQLLGVLLAFNGGLMLLAVGMSWMTQDQATQQLLTAAFSVLLLGLFLLIAFREAQPQIQKREGYLVVSLGWMVMTLTGMLPYLMTDSVPSVSHAFFETMSGYTTTGATIFDDIESLPKGLLFWRSITHWIGGMGIIVLTIAILPILGIGGMQLFAAEVPGPNSDKLHPRITDTAKRLWLLYFGYTLAETFLLWFAGMSFFDAINHAMSTLSTGGFSTKNNSIAFWNDQPLIQYIILFFMLVAGTNFVLSYFGFTGNFRKIFKDIEFQYYLWFIGLFTLLVTSVLLLHNTAPGLPATHPQQLGLTESAFRHSLFQVVAIITTTGFVTADFTAWPPLLTLTFFGLMFIGGSAGSTSGGIKVVRHLLMIRSGILEFKRALHPNAILQVRYNNRVVSEGIVQNILGFFILYLLSFIIGTLGFAMMGFDFESSVGVAASSLGNVGPALGVFGPAENYTALPSIGLWWSSFLMLLGRLELFTVLILLTPFFWRKN